MEREREEVASLFISHTHTRSAVMLILLVFSHVGALPLLTEGRSHLLRTADEVMSMMSMMRLEKTLVPSSSHADVHFRGSSDRSHDAWFELSV